jgi:hypothetical protein
MIHNASSIFEILDVVYVISPLILPYAERDLGSNAPTTPSARYQGSVMESHRVMRGPLRRSMYLFCASICGLVPRSPQSYTRSWSYGSSNLAALSPTTVSLPTASTSEPTEADDVYSESNTMD